MPLAITETAHFRLATTALPIFLPIFLVYIRWLDPLTASASWTIYSILGRELLKLPVPRLLKIVVK